MTSEQKIDNTFKAKQRHRKETGNIKSKDNYEQNSFFSLFRKNPPHYLGAKNENGQKDNDALQSVE